MKFNVVLVGTRNKKEVVHLKILLYVAQILQLGLEDLSFTQSDWFKEHYEAVTIQPFLSLTFARKVK